MGEKTSTGLEENVAGLLCYLLGFVTGIIFYLIEKENKAVRFHAVQSIIVFGALAVVGWVLLPILMMLPIVGWIIEGFLGLILSVVSLALWVVLMYKAYKGEKFKVPVAGNLAEKYV